eukprot:gene10448-7427_t
MFELEVGRMTFVNPNHVKPDTEVSCSIKFQGNELGRTEPANPAQPVWNEKISLNHFDVNGLESVHNRPFYLEYLTLEVLQKGNKVLETRIPLTCIDKPPTFYKLLRPEGQESKHDKAHEASYLLLSMRSVDEALREWVPCFDRCELRHVLPAQPNLHYLYASMDNTQPSTTYRFGLPGPTCGEQLVDMRRHVEWRLPSQTNSFGDVTACTVRGNLYISDLRLIFLPTDITFPFHASGLTNHAIRLFPESDIPLSDTALQYLHRFTVQIPVSSIEDIRFGKYLGETVGANGSVSGPGGGTTVASPATATATATGLASGTAGGGGGGGGGGVDGAAQKMLLSLDTLDRTTLDFIVSTHSSSSLRKKASTSSALGQSSVRVTHRRLPAQLALHQAFPTAGGGSSGGGGNGRKAGAGKSGGGGSSKGRPLANRFVYKNPSSTGGTKYHDPFFAFGLESDDVPGDIWIDRVVDGLIFALRRDEQWWLWARHWQTSLRHQLTVLPTMVGTPSISPRDWGNWLKTSVTALDLDDDYQRCQVQDLHWRLSDLNAAYRLCHSYPASLCFPGSLSDDDILQAATQRSIGRLPAMVWMHPETKAPLCRAAQPLTGVSGLINKEHDKKMCLAIRELCPTRLPLRIADARPKLNANANAMQGKGFENIAYFGGASVASLVFLDIDNIHVMRSSLHRAKDALTEMPVFVSNTTSTLTLSDDVTLEDSSLSSFASSKWLQHVAAVLRGAVAIADSLHAGYPMLVHCSDGWDRTAQLSALAQLLLDPYYRTMDGFLRLVHKEWSSFGHKFEDRLGRGHHSSKEVSPVFVQFLDCVYQLLRQYPLQFEFTEYFLTLLVHATYSGLFVSLRCNNEQERMLWLLQSQKLSQETMKEARKYRPHMQAAAAAAAASASASTGASTAATTGATASHPTKANPIATATPASTAGGAAAAPHSIAASLAADHEELARVVTQAGYTVRSSTAPTVATTSAIIEPELWQCTSLAFYVHMLRACPAQALLLTNPHYVPVSPSAGVHHSMSVSTSYASATSTSNASFSFTVAPSPLGSGSSGGLEGTLGGTTGGLPRANYLRPKVQAVHLAIWTEGLFGLNANMLSCVTGVNELALTDLEVRVTVAERVHALFEYERLHMRHITDEATTSATLADTVPVPPVGSSPRNSTSSSGEIDGGTAPADVPTSAASTVTPTKAPSLLASSGTSPSSSSSSSYLATQLSTYWETATTLAPTASLVPVLSPYYLASMRQCWPREAAHERFVSLSRPLSYVPVYGQHPDIYGAYETHYVPARITAAGEGTATSTSTTTSASNAATSTAHAANKDSGGYTLWERGIVDHYGRETDRYINWSLLAQQYTADLTQLTTPQGHSDLALLLTRSSYEVVVHLTRVKTRLWRWYRAIKAARHALVAYDVVPRTYYSRFPYGTQCTMAQRKKLSLQKTQQTIGAYRSIFTTLAYARLTYVERYHQTASRKALEAFIVHDLLQPLIDTVVDRDVQVASALFVGAVMTGALRGSSSHDERHLSGYYGGGGSGAMGGNGASANGEDLSKMMKDLSKKSKKKITSLLKTFTFSSSTPSSSSSASSASKAVGSGEGALTHAGGGTGGGPSKSRDNDGDDDDNGSGSGAANDDEEQLIDEFLARASMAATDRGAEEEEDDDDGETTESRSNLRPVSSPPSSTAAATGVRPGSVSTPGSASRPISVQSASGNNSNRGSASPMRSWTRYLTG